MSLGIARPAAPPVMPVRPTTPEPTRPAVIGEDPARIRATIARAPLFAALPINAAIVVPCRTVRVSPLMTTSILWDIGGETSTHRRGGCSQVGCQ